MFQHDDAVEAARPVLQVFLIDILAVLRAVKAPLETSPVPVCQTGKAASVPPEADPAAVEDAVIAR
jgi:hypothetical protein